MTHKQIPVILQTQTAESGSVSLSMLFAYHNLFKSQNEMRYECGITNNGTDLKRLQSAAINNNFDTNIIKKDIDELYNLKHPVILRDKDNNFSLLKYSKNKKFIINDPKSGEIQLDRNELFEIYSGEVLECIPNNNFKPKGKRKSTLESIFDRLSGDKKAFYFVSLFGLLLIVTGIAFPGFFKIFIDDVLILKQTDWYKPLLLAMGIAIIYNGIITYLQQSVLLKLEIKMALTQSAKFITHLFKLPVDFFQGRDAGELIKRVQSNDLLAKILSDDLSNNFINLLSVSFYAIVMFKYNVWLTLVGVSFAIINLLALKLVSTKKTTLNQKQIQNRGKTFSTGTMGLEMIETIKSSGSENDFFSLWSGYQADMVNNDQKLGFTDRLISTLPEFLQDLNNIIIICLGSFLILYGEITVGLLIAFQSLMNNFSKPIQEVVDMGGKLQEATSMLRTVDDAMETPIDPVFKQEKDIHDYKFEINEAKLDGKIELKNISFGYDRFSDPLISNFSITIEPGKRIALVGGSGSGKSTIAKMIIGLLSPWEGEILIDGKPRDQYNLDTLSNSISMVDQDIFLFYGTVSENITMWNSTVSKEKIIQSAKDACIHDIISQRPDTYDSTVAPRGANFSGGQQQRIEIARALVKDPSILIMDEATSALDPNTEQIIDFNIRKRACTTIIVAHRLSTIRDCDEIIVIDKGHVVQRGTHEEMIKEKDKFYYKLIKQS